MGMTGQAWIRLRDARPLIEWVIRDAIEECGLTVHVLPEEIISDREALSRLLAAEGYRITVCHSGADALRRRTRLPSCRRSR